MSAELEIQKAVILALKAYAPLTALLSTVTSIYDNVPQVADGGDNSVFPYVVLGDDTSIEFDTDDTNGHETTLTIHIWSRKRPRKETKQIMGEVYNSLHKTNLVVTGYNTVLVQYEFSSTEKDPDGITTHGVIRFRIIIIEA